jgi:hypothetical protein
MSAGSAILAAARSPGAALLRLRRGAPAAAPFRIPGLGVGPGCRRIAMAAAADSGAPAPADPLPKVPTRRRERACFPPARVAKGWDMGCQSRVLFLVTC